MSCRALLKAGGIAYAELPFFMLERIRSIEFARLARSIQ